MRLQYFVPGPMSKGPLGPQELLRREAKLSEWAGQTAQIVVRDAPDGPLFIESAEDAAGADEIVLNGARAAEEAGYEAVIIGCFGDPGVAGARAALGIHVVGPGEAAMEQAGKIGRFSIITLLDDTVPLHEIQIREAGRTEDVASIKPTGIRVLDLPKDRHFTAQRMIEVGREAVRQDGATVLVLGCMSMSFLGVDDEVAREIGVPVINPSRAALASLNALAGAAVAAGNTDERGAQQMSAAK